MGLPLFYESTGRSSDFPLSGRNCFSMSAYAVTLLCSLDRDPSSSEVANMRRCITQIWLVVFLSLFANAQSAARWTEAQANDWYARQPWIIGSNYLPANAINELEMW